MTCDDSDDAVSVVFFHTYMPPRSLLGSAAMRLELVDLMGAPGMELARTLQMRASLTHRAWRAACGGGLFVVMPATLLPAARDAAASVAHVHLAELRSFWPHLSLEDLPMRAADARLLLVEAIVPRDIFSRRRARRPTREAVWPQGQGT